MSHPINPVSGSDVSLFEPLICIASCFVMGCCSSLLEEHMAIVQKRLMRVTRPSKALSGVHLAAGSDAAHMASYGRGRWPCTCTPRFHALSGHLPAIVIQDD